MTIVTARTSNQGLRLLHAVTAAFAVLDEDGFQVRDSQLGHDRGATVVVASDTVSIEVTGDWYERQLSISLKVTGSPWLPIERLLPDLPIASRPLPRNAKRGALEDRLNKTVTALREQAPEVLRGGPEAVARVLQTGT